MRIRYQEIGDQNGAALAKLGLGDVFLSMGKHAEAKKAYQEAQEICHELGNPAREASALAALARLLRLAGDSASAWKNESEAISMFEKVGDKSEMEHVRVQLADLLLDQGKNGEAARLAQQASELFQETKADDGSGRYLYLIDPSSYAVSRIGPYSGILGPYTVDGVRRYAVNNVTGLWGMQVANIKTGQIGSAHESEDLPVVFLVKQSGD